MSFNCDVFFMLSLGRGIIYWKKKKNHPIGGRKENVVIVVDWKFIFGFLYWPQNKLVVVQLKERSVNLYKWRYKEFWKKKINKKKSSLWWFEVLETIVLCSYIVSSLDFVLSIPFISHSPYTLGPITTYDKDLNWS